MKRFLFLALGILGFVDGISAAARVAADNPYCEWFKGPPCSVSCYKGPRPTPHSDPACQQDLDDSECGGSKADRLDRLSVLSSKDKKAADKTIEPIKKYFPGMKCEKGVCKDKDGNIICDGEPMY